MKDMFYNGFKSWNDGKCSDCSCWSSKNYGEELTCNETCQDVKNYVIHGRINFNCPYLQKGE